MRRKTANCLRLISLAILPVLVPGSLFSAAGQGGDNWNHYCKKCHGKNGMGKTFFGKELEVRDFTDPAVQSKFTDEKMLHTIREGVKREGKTKMKAYGKKLSDEEIKDLLKYVRSFGK